MWPEAHAADKRLARIGAVAAVLALSAATGFRAWRLIFHDYANEHVPYAYVQTYESLSNFTEPARMFTRETRPDQAAPAFAQDSVGIAPGRPYFAGA